MADFSDVTPTWVIPLDEDYNVTITQSENLRKTFDLLSATPVIGYRLLFNGVTDGQFAAILAHYRGVSGTFAAFTWNTVPSYIDGGGGVGISMLGRWAGKPKFTPKSKSWDVEMMFEKDQG